MEKTKTAFTSLINKIENNFSTLESGKQDTISDLDTIRSGASAGATALQSVPDEYITETELSAKGYLTSVPSTYALKTDIPSVPTFSYADSTLSITTT